MRRELAVAVLTLVVAACSAAPPTSTAGPTGSAAPESTGVPLTGPAIDVTPATVLLTEVGQTRTLAAAAQDGTKPQVAWTSSDPAVVSVDAAGVVTGNALGSAQVVAEAAGGRSAPVLVVVASLAPGVTAIPDEQIVGEPVDSNPGAPPAADNTYVITVSETAAQVGQLLVGTGERALAGRVVAAAPAGANTQLTMQLVPLNELMPGLSIEESIDLSNAPVSVPTEVGTLYDVTFAGNVFNFTPKPDFAARVWRDGAIAAVGGMYAQAVGTSALPPFTECETELSSLPISLAEAPSFSVEIEPRLDYQTTPAGGFGHWIVRATPTAEINAGFKFEASFEGKIACKAELFVFRIPVAGALSFFLGGLVPVGVGFELSGKVTLASFGLGTTVSTSATAELGLACVSGSCGVHRELGSFDLSAEHEVDAPNLSDIRLEPSLEIFAFAEADIGNPFLSSLRFEAVEVKAGGKLAADWAPRLVQILDSTYASSYSLSLEAGASVGPDLGEIAEMLGIELTWAELTISNDLAGSPTGTVRSDRASYADGEEGVVTVELAEENLTFLSAYNITSVMLVRYSGGTETVLNQVDATDGQRTFELDFFSEGPTNASELYAFIVTRIPPIDQLALEVGHATGAEPTPTPTPAAGPGWHGVFSSDGLNPPVEFDVEFEIQSNPSKISLFDEFPMPNFNAGQLPFVNVSGRLALEAFDDVVDGQFDFMNGPQMPPCGGQFRARGTWDREAGVIDLTLDGTDRCGFAYQNPRLVLTFTGE